MQKQDQKNTRPYIPFENIRMIYNNIYKNT